MFKDELDEYIRKICDYKSLQVFNPYRDVCRVSDGKKSPQIRLKNLNTYLQQAKKLNLKIIWVGEALGYRGGRRTGIPFSDESKLKQLSSQYHAHFKKSTNDVVVRENTAGAIWNAIKDLHTKPILWNVFPFHPFKSDYKSNRQPTSSELESTGNLFDELYQLYNNPEIFAVGRVSERILRKRGYDVTYIRHPSYGGANEFRIQVKRLFD